MHLTSKKNWSRSFRFSSLKEIFQDDLERTVPARINFLHYLGAVACILISFQLGTGILLMVYYRPATEEAYASMAMIRDEVRLGWLVQGLHRWGADLLMLLALLHLVRVYFSRAYQAPRQFNWIVGLFLLLFTTLTHSPINFLMQHYRLVNHDGYGNMDSADLSAANALYGMSVVHAISSGNKWE